jgi:hypothetical protein
MKILIKEEQLKLIEQIQKANQNIFKNPNNWSRVKSFEYKNKPVTLYYDNETDEFHLNDIGTKNTRQLLKSEYRDVSSVLSPFNVNYLMNWKRDYKLTNRLNGNDNSKLNAEKVLDKNPYEINPNASKTSNPVKPKPVSTVKPNQVGAVKPNQVGTVKRNPEEQRWVGIWEKFLVKYVGFTGGDKDNLTSDIDKAVYKFISQNNKLYTKNKNIKLGNLEKLMTDGKKGPVHDSFLPPYYYNTDTFPIYFYQKSNIIKEIQKKLGVKQTGIFLNQTESAIVKRIKVKNGQGYNIKYDRRNGITQEIYDAIMSGDEKIVKGKTPELIPTKQNTSLEPVSDKIKTDLSNRIK